MLYVFVSVSAAYVPCAACVCMLTFCLRALHSMKLHNNLFIRPTDTNTTPIKTKHTCIVQSYNTTQKQTRVCRRHRRECVCNSMFEHFSHFRNTRMFNVLIINTHPQHAHHNYLTPPPIIIPCLDNDFRFVFDLISSCFFLSLGDGGSLQICSNLDVNHK